MKYEYAITNSYIFIQFVTFRALFCPLLNRRAIQTCRRSLRPMGNKTSSTSTHARHLYAHTSRHRRKLAIRLTA